MGFIKLFSSSEEPAMGCSLHSGSFTVNAQGDIVTSTLPHSFPKDKLQMVASTVLRTFREAHDLQMPLTELMVHFSGLKVTARELRGGAIIFLAPKATKKV